MAESTEEIRKKLVLLFEEGGLDAVVEREAEAIARKDGTYFSKMDDIFDFPSTPIGAETDFENIRRKKMRDDLYPEITQLLKKQPGEGGTYTAASPYKAASPYDGTSSGVPTLEGEKGLTEFIDLFGNKGPALTLNRAHLLPFKPVCSKTYPYVGEAVLGVDCGADARQRLKLLKGIKKGTFRRQRVSCSGLVIHPLDVVRLKGQASFFDEYSSLIILPVMSLEEVLSWRKNSPYDVIAFAGGQFAESCSAEVLQNAGECSGREALGQIAPAAGTLTAFIKGMHSMLKHKDVLESVAPTIKSRITGALPPAKKKDGAAMRSFRDLVRRIKEEEKTTQRVPVLKDAQNPVVAWHRFEKGQHMPDPMLLFIKAAINISALKDEKILPACPSASSLDEEWNVLLDRLIDAGREREVLTARENVREALSRAQQSSSYKTVQLFSRE